jgi:hypothetical protein
MTIARLADANVSFLALIANRLALLVIKFITKSAQPAAPDARFRAMRTLPELEPCAKSGRSLLFGFLVSDGQGSRLTRNH